MTHHLPRQLSIGLMAKSSPAIQLKCLLPQEEQILIVVVAAMEEAEEDVVVDQWDVEGLVGPLEEVAVGVVVVDTQVVVEASNELETGSAPTRVVRI